MADPNVDRQHCYECGDDDVVFASLYPLESVLGKGGTMMPDGEGNRRHDSLKFSVDFNVCAECYYDQWQRRYSNEAVPQTVIAAVKET